MIVFSLLANIVIILFTIDGVSKIFKYWGESPKELNKNSFLITIISLLLLQLLYLIGGFWSHYGWPQTLMGLMYGFIVVNSYVGSKKPNVLTGSPTWGSWVTLSATLFEQFILYKGGFWYPLINLING